MTADINADAQRGFLTIDLVGCVATTDGAMGSILNPEGVHVMVLRSWLHVKTPSTAAATIGVGIGASATTHCHDLIDALAIDGAITAKVYNGSTIQTTTKTEVGAPAVWGEDEYLVFTSNTNSSIGFTGEYFVEYVRLA